MKGLERIGENETIFNYQFNRLAQVVKYCKQVMTNKCMTLAQVAKDVENGFFWTNEPVNIKIAGFDSFDDFQMFFNRHYRPILERVRTGKPLTDKETHILHLLCDDMLAAIPEDEE